MSVNRCKQSLPAMNANRTFVITVIRKSTIKGKGPNINIERYKSENLNPETVTAIQCKKILLSHLMIEFKNNQTKNQTRVIFLIYFYRTIFSQT